MKIPRGRLIRSRVVSDPAIVLEAALERELTGYAVLEPQDALLLGGETRGVLTFEDGVPVLAYDTATDRGGPDALADLAVPGPYRVDLYALDPGDLEDAHGTTELRVPPGVPAERLAGAPALADRTRAAAPADRIEDAAAANPVEAFLADGEKIAAIRERAREEARTRAEEWGLAGELAADETADGTVDEATDETADGATDETVDGTAVSDAGGTDG